MYLQVVCALIATQTKQENKYVPLVLLEGMTELYKQLTKIVEMTEEMKNPYPRDLLDFNYRKSSHYAFESARRLMLSKLDEMRKKELLNP
jgi:hypothetical protein